MTLSARFTRKVSTDFHVDANLVLPGDSFEVTVLFGPSGAGKTSILRAIAGLDRPGSGRIECDGETWFDGNVGVHVPARRRRIGFLFQHYALFPHLHARSNIEFGIRSLSRIERMKRVDSLIEMLQLRGIERRFPSQLSGGEQQRVALARTLALSPRLLLLDEPLSALDLPTREIVRRQLRDWLAPFEIPTLLVTHDRTEAIALSNRIVLVDRGRTIQAGPTLEVLRSPSTPAAARIVGVETIEPARLVGVDEGTLSIDVAGRTLRAAPREETAGLKVGDAVVICIRGEEVLLELGSPHPSSARNRLPAKVVRIEAEGSIWRVTVDVGFPLAALITRSALDEMRLEVGSEVTAMIKAHGIHVIAR
jgi:molybdate transport system ATP-binding protein